MEAGGGGEGERFYTFIVIITHQLDAPPWHDKSFSLSMPLLCPVLKPSCNGSHADRRDSSPRVSSRKDSRSGSGRDKEVKKKAIERSPFHQGGIE